MKWNRIETCTEQLLGTKGGRRRTKEKQIITDKDVVLLRQDEKEERKRYEYVHLLLYPHVYNTELVDEDARLRTRLRFASSLALPPQPGLVVGFYNVVRHADKALWPPPP